MVTVKGDTLCIVIRDAEPEQRREQLIKDIAAAMRWYASSGGRYDKDNECVYRIGQLLEELSMCD